MKKTQLQLSLIFSAIVFLIILCFWLLFFSVKYYQELKQEYNRFQSWLEYIQKNNLQWKDLENIQFFPNINENFSNKNIDILSGFQFISLNNENKILSSNIHEKINHKELVEYILDEDDVYEIDYLGNYYVSKLPIKEGNFAILKGLKYDLEDFISDIIVYFLLSLVVSTGVFFIGRKFIIRVLRPVEENIKSMNEFIHNAGHELKTPLSVIDSNIQIIDDIQQYDALMNTEIRKELAKMVELLNTLTDLSNIQNEKSKEKCNIWEVIQDICAQYKEKIKEKEIEIEIYCDIGSDFVVVANKYSVFIFLSNIIWNAVKYNKQNWKIMISSISDWMLSVKDTGIWIPRNLQQKVFERFYQIDTSRSSEWFGIWLSLVQKISEMNNWKVDIRSEEWEYTEFIINFKH